MVFGLLERGIKRVHLANRTIERALALADQFREAVRPVAWEAVAEVLPRAGLLVNTTSLGMSDQPALKLDVGLLSPHAIVADLVYVPLETALLKAARQRGLRTADGLGMLLHQAVRGFELWFGQKATRSPPETARVGGNRSPQGLGRIPDAFAEREMASGELEHIPLRRSVSQLQAFAPDLKEEKFRHPRRGLRS